MLLGKGAKLLPVLDAMTMPVLIALRCLGTASRFPALQLAVKRYQPFLRKSSLQGAGIAVGEDLLFPLVCRNPSGISYTCETIAVLSREGTKAT